MTAIRAVVCSECDGTVSITAPPGALVDLGSAIAGAAGAVVEVAPAAAARPGYEYATRIRVRWDSNPGVSVARDGTDLALIGDQAAVAVLGAEHQQTRQ